MDDILHSTARLRALIDELRSLPSETSWVEFKENNSDPKMIGRLISALSNSARLADQHFAYVVWGIQDGDHTVTGTSFEPSSQKEQNQVLELWLSQRLQPGCAFAFKVVDHHGVKVVLLEIPAAATSPVEFDRTAYIRMGSATPRLSDYSEIQRSLWAKLQPYVWESGIAMPFLTSDDVLERLDYAHYFDLTGQPLPDNRNGIFDKLNSDRLVQKDVGGRWNITNLGAVLFAKKLSDFPVAIARKSIRFVVYDGFNRADTVTHRLDVEKGYALGFSSIIDHIHALLPKNEHIGKTFREESPLYPSIAVREIIANALIHQDMTIRGTGPLIELFKDRLEITNPGHPLVNPDRFLDFPPRSRNEALAALMRRMRMCEEQGTGIDKVLVSVELHQLPPPDFREENSSVRVVLFAPRRFAEMTQDERIRACYWHAALMYVSGRRMKNATLCTRFGIESQNSSQASAVIRLAQERKLIRPADPDHPRAGYIPFWA